MTLDSSHLIEIQPNREPYLFIENVLEVNAKQSAINEIYMKPDNWYFKCHWEGDPNMPAMMQLEAMTQTASLCLFLTDKPPNKLYVVSISSASFRKKVTPKMTIRVNANKIKEDRNIYTFKSVIRDKKSNVLISKAIFELMWPK